MKNNGIKKNKKNYIDDKGRLIAEYTDESGNVIREYEGVEFAEETIDDHVIKKFVNKNGFVCHKHIYSDESETNCRIGLVWNVSKAIQFNYIRALVAIENKRAEENGKLSLKKGTEEKWKKELEEERQNNIETYNKLLKRNSDLEKPSTQ